MFKKDEWVLIFPEGYCKHQTAVMPLKKGFVTMTQRAWTEGIDLYVVPVSITYDSFTNWGKKCDVVFGKPIQMTDIHGDTLEQAAQLNELLYARLSENFPTRYQFQGKNILWGWFGQCLYYIGWVFQFPVYFVSQYLSKRFTKGSVFYDSATIGLLSVLLIFYYLLFMLIGISISICY